MRFESADRRDGGVGWGSAFARGRGHWRADRGGRPIGDLARATIESIVVLGALNATPQVKAALADRLR